MNVPAISTLDINRALIAAINDCMRWNPGEERVLMETRAGIRPYKGLYATFWWKNIRYLKQVNGDAKYTLENHIYYEHRKNEAECEIDITFRGPTAWDACHAFRQYLEGGARAFDLWKLIGFMDATRIQDLSAVYNGAVQERAYFTLGFYAAFQRRYPMDWFNKVDLSVNQNTLNIQEH